MHEWLFRSQAAVGVVRDIISWTYKWQAAATKLQSRCADRNSADATTKQSWAQLSTASMSSFPNTQHMWRELSICQANSRGSGDYQGNRQIKPVPLRLPSCACFGLDPSDLAVSKGNLQSGKSTNLQAREDAYAECSRVGPARGA